MNMEEIIAELYLYKLLSANGYMVAHVITFYCSQCRSGNAKFAKAKRRG